MRKPSMSAVLPEPTHSTTEGEIQYAHGPHRNGSANPRRSNAAWIMESPEFVRFVNPGDLRVARYACGECHKEQTENTRHSMMAHGAMLWNAALYNNGSSNQKVAAFGEAYTFDGQPAQLRSVPMPTPEETRLYGILPCLNPLPRATTSLSQEIFCAHLNRGGKVDPQTTTSR